MAEFQITFISGQLEGFEKIISLIKNSDIPEDIKQLLLNQIETKKEELRFQRDKLI